MVLATIILVILIFIFLVNFVVANIDMFQTSFDIVIGIPFVESWSVTLEGIKFIYIVGGSVLLGALVIAIGTWVLDAKRKITFYRMTKELKRLEQAIQEARASLPTEEQPSSETGVSEADMPPEKVQDASTVTPEEITKSFEHAVEEKGMLEEQDEFGDGGEEGIPQEPPVESEKPLSQEDVTPDTERRITQEAEEQTEGSEKPLTQEDELSDAEKSIVEESPREAEVSGGTVTEKDATVEREKSFSQETPVEAEVIESHDEEEGEREEEKKPRQQKE